MADLSEQYSTFIKNYNENASCDAECQQQKKLASLKQNYYNALNNLNSAPEKVQATYQAYLTFAEGGGAYQQYQQGTVQQEAETKANNIQTNFNNEIENAQRLLSSYSGLYENYYNIYELNNIYKDENYDLQIEADTSDSDALTNDRKTYYELQAIDSLQKYYWILSIIYTIVVIYFIISMLTKQSIYSATKKVFVLLFLIIYPFISLWLVLKANYLYNYIINLFPKDQYQNL